MTCSTPKLQNNVVSNVQCYLWNWQFVPVLGAKENGRNYRCDNNTPARSRIPQSRPMQRRWSLRHAASIQSITQLLTLIKRAGWPLVRFVDASVFDALARTRTRRHVNIAAPSSTEISADWWVNQTRDRCASLATASAFTNYKSLALLVMHISKRLLSYFHWNALRLANIDRCMLHSCESDSILTVSRLRPMVKGIFPG